MLLFAFSIIYASPLDSLDKKSKKDSSEMALMTLGAYQHLVDNDLDSFYIKMNEIGFEITKISHCTAETGIKIDSLIFQNNQEMKWAIFRNVDIEYVRIISGFVLFQSDEDEQFIHEFLEIMKNENIAVQESRTSDELIIEIVDTSDSLIVDKRWKEPTLSEYSSLYTYRILLSNDFIEIQFQQIVPKESIPKSPASKYQASALGLE
jgi:hypothetical protein